MWRLLVIGAVVATATLAGDILFRASLLRVVRPVILAPTDGAAVSLPVRVRWEGPRRMRVIVRHAGRERWDLGVRESPAELPTKYFTRRGLYSVEIKSPRLGDWISNSRSFSIKTARVAPAAREQAGLSRQLAALQKSLLGLQSAQEEMRDENTSLYEESAAIREENAILTEELNRLAEGERRARNRAAALERQYAELQEAHRVLLEESQRLRARIAEVIPCTVWGYFSYAGPEAFGAATRRLTVSDDRGEILRARRDCERERRSDSSATSPCYCVGNSWGG